MKLNPEKLEIGLGAITFTGHHITREDIGFDTENSQGYLRLGSSRNCGSPPQVSGHDHLRREVHPKPDNHHKASPRSNQEGFSRDTIGISTGSLWHSEKNDYKLAWSCLLWPPPTFKELLLENDTCEYSLGAALKQADRPVTFASRSLRYWISICTNWGDGLEKFHHYTHRREVTVPTDHKTLVLINQKPLSKAPKQLQNLHVYTEIQLYTQVQAKKGVALADMLSWASTNKPEMKDFLVVTMQPTKDHRLAQICCNTVEDPTITALAEVIARAWPDKKKVLYDSLNCSSITGMNSQSKMNWYYKDKG